MAVERLRRPSAPHPHRQSGHRLKGRLPDLLALSPCIDAGIAGNAPSADKDEVARPLDGRNTGLAPYDIGAYEFIHPLADTDHDGMADISEIISGTNPLDPDSVHKIEATAAPMQNQLVLRWPSVTSRSYTVEFKSALDPAGVWQVLESSILGSGSILERRDTFQGTRRFYRLGMMKN
jgi:hypothetical protein